MSKLMTGRERVLAVLAHEQPDRVPFDLAGTRDTTLVVEGYERLKAHFGIDAPTELCNRMMRVAKLGFHSCGSIASVIDDLIEIGVDVLNPIQVTAAGMGPVTLKQKYGNRLAFWGAMDTQNVLPKGSVDDVRRMVEKRIGQLGEGGGYILASCHNIQSDVPVENVLAMFEHARNYRPTP